LLHDTRFRKKYDDVKDSTIVIVLNEASNLSMLLSDLIDYLFVVYI